MVKYACFQHFSKPAPSPVLKVLVGICSSRTTALRRAAVRDTWMKRLPAGVQAVFFVGRGGGNGETDVFEMTTADDYPGLPSKVHAFCRHALEHHEFDYLFKCDDDTYLVPGRLLELAANNTPFVGSSAFAPRGFASGGAGYLISREAVSAIAAALPPGPRDIFRLEGAEDVWVSNLLREHGFPLTPTPLLQPRHDRLPHLANDIVTAHYCGPDLMRVIDRLITDARIVAVLNAEHAFWQGPVKLLSNSLFLGGASAPHGRWEWDAPAQTLILQWFHWPPDRLELRDWGLEAPNLRLQFESGEGPNEFRRAMAQLLSVIETQSLPLNTTPHPPCF
jgi:hypothetical protein